jgi:hypothetical protein
MDLNKALELSVISSWGDLVKAGEKAFVKVEYENVTGAPLRWLEVWTSRNRGYGSLVCRFSAAPLLSSSGAGGPLVHFANSYHSKNLSDALDFVLRNQSRFTRLSSLSGQTSVRLDQPTDQNRSDAAAWIQSVSPDFAKAAASN